MSEPTTAWLEIVRDTAEDIQDRWIRVFVDDTPVGILKYGEKIVCEVAPGAHRVKVHNTLSRHTLEVEVAAGERQRIRCHNAFTRGGALSLLTIGFAHIAVRLEVVR